MKPRLLRGVNKLENSASNTYSREGYVRLFDCLSIFMMLAFSLFPQPRYLRSLAAGKEADSARQLLIG